ncbi:hypothetical protein [Chungangia koreensis]|uniref:hypothetical protein n=1 Tax=Chungangia koreensis TaxID=752657 RepID=UPI00367282E1
MLSVFLILFTEVRQTAEGVNASITDILSVRGSARARGTRPPEACAAGIIDT